MPIQTIDWERRTIREADLPADWRDTVSSSSTAIGPYYDGYLRAETFARLMEGTVDGMLAERIKADNYKRIANIGVGGGERLRRVADLTGRELYLVGTDIISGMLKVAAMNRIRGVQHDMTQPLPFKPGSLDAIVWLTGDFGYLMDPVNGRQIRQNTVEQAYHALEPGGMFFAEMQMQDTQNQDRPGRVRRDTGQMQHYGAVVGEYVFYTKMFRFGELRDLMDKSSFGAERSTLFYMMRNTVDDLGNPGFANSGKVSAIYKGLKGFELTQIHPNPANPREWYNGILIGRKGR
ncbi:class I SAM-dependent methyltransferase [Candidatus Woesearchaeota archaeon]|nr:class I SAM-dependent methyltransferase [Candidatus Woesearchaeota archaeon]